MPESERDFIAQLDKAIMDGDKDAISAIVKNSKKHIKGFNVLLSYASPESGLPVLHAAIEYAQPDVFAFLVNKLAVDPNSRDSMKTTPLVYAASKGQLAVVELLLNNKKVDANIANIDATTALHYLVRFNASSSDEITHLTEAWKALVKRKINVNARTSFGETPLHQATRALNPHAISFLVNEGADVNALNNKGETCLHYSVLVGDCDVAEQLLILGVNKEIRTKDRVNYAFIASESAAAHGTTDGYTALDYARSLEMEEMAALISTYHAKLGGDQQLFMQMRKYLRMINLINEEPTVLIWLQDMIDKADMDNLAKAVLHVSMPMGTTVFLCRNLMEQEFVHFQSDSAAILRGNSLTSKLMGMFSRKISQSYLKNTMSSLVNNVVMSEGKLDFELDPSKISLPGVDVASMPEAQLQELKRQQIELNKVALMTQANDLLIKITRSVMTFPREVRALSGFIAEFCMKYAPEKKESLIGGYIMLRLINPTLATPESYNMLPMGKLPSPHARRNLVLLTKLLQQLSNGVYFGSKEESMVCLNEFIDTWNVKFKAFLNEVTVDDPLSASGLGFSVAVNPVNIPWEKEKAKPKKREIDLGMLEFKQLTYLHRLFYDYGDQVLAKCDPKDNKAIKETVQMIKEWGKPEQKN